MADEILTDKDDEDFVIIEEPATAEPKPEGEDLKPEGEAPPAIEDDDDEIDDERLGANESDTEEGLTKTQIDRRERRARAKRAKEREAAELADLRQFKSVAEQRLAAIEGNALGLNEATIQARIDRARANIATAEHVRQQADEQGNTSDVIEAIRHRDAAYAEIAQLEPALNDIKRLRTQPQQQPQAVNPAIDTHASAWKAANPWYSDTGADENSVLTRQVAAQLAKDGVDAGTPVYWQTLTRKLTSLVAAQPQPKPNGQQPRKAPPTGQRGEGAAPNGQPREVRLSAERITAIKEAGKWDDPKERYAMAKAYQDYDRQQTANRAGE